MNKKNRYINIFANILMIIGLIIILIPLVYLILGWGNLSYVVSLVGIIIGLIGVYISKKIHKN